MLDNFKSCNCVVVVDAVHHSVHLYTLRKQVVEVNFIVNVSIVRNVVSHGSRHSLLTVAYRGGVWVVQTPPKFRSFDTAAFDCKLSGKCLVFLF